MKKYTVSILSFILALTLILSFVSCEKDDGKADESTAAATEQLTPETTSSPAVTQSPGTSGTPGTQKPATEGTVESEPEVTGPEVTEPEATDPDKDTDGTGKSRELLSALIGPLAALTEGDSSSSTRLTFTSMAGMLGLDISNFDRRIVAGTHIGEDGERAAEIVSYENNTELERYTLIGGILYRAKTDKDGNTVYEKASLASAGEDEPDGTDGETGQSGELPSLPGGIDPAQITDLILNGNIDITEYFSETSSAVDENGNTVVTIAKPDSKKLNGLLANLLTLIVPYDYEESGEDDADKPISERLAGMLIDAVRNDQIVFDFSLKAVSGPDNTPKSVLITAGVVINLEMGGASVPLRLAAITADTVFDDLDGEQVEVKVPENADEYSETTLSDMFGLSRLAELAGDPGEDDSQTDQV